jgi:hypothetical protein
LFWSFLISFSGRPESPKQKNRAWNACVSFPRDLLNRKTTQSSVAFIGVKTQTTLGKSQHGDTSFRDPSVDCADANPVSPRQVVPREYYR